MTLLEYTDACIRFSAETESWGGLDPYQHYTTTGSDWQESCDNASGGLDVSWAFRLSEEKIQALACGKFLELLTAELEQGIDEGWDAGQWAVMARRYA